MKYEVIPQDETVMVKITEDGITEQLSLMEPPGKESSLVVKSKKDVLGEINLEKMLSNLDNCVDLLQITFNAVDGFDVQDEVQELSNRFLDAMTESNTTALDFKLATEQVLEAYINAYGNLFYGEVETAMMLLTDTKGIAVQMVKKADELVVVFSELTDYTNSVLKEVMKERSADEQKRSETKAMINELQGSLDAMEELKENLQNDIEQANADYEKLLKREMKQEERAYNMQLASMIIGAVSGLFGVASDTVSTAKKDREAAESQTESEMGETSAEVQAKRNYTENIGKQEQNKSAVKKIDERIAAIDKILDGQLYKDGANHASADTTDLDVQKTGEELRKEKQNKVEEKGRLQLEMDKLKGEETILGKTLSGFGAVMDEVAENTRSAAQEIQKTADSLAERLDAIEKKRNVLKKQERENLVNLKKNTAKMQNMVMDENELESAIQCLVIAIGCLRRVLAYLHEIKLFWSNVETFCNSLDSNESITKLIEMQRTKEPEQSAAYFKTIIFVKGYLGMVAKWQALYVIFEEYLRALAKVSKRMSETMEQELSDDRKVQWQLATKLSGKLNAKLQSEIDEII